MSERRHGSDCFCQAAALAQDIVRGSLRMRSRLQGLVSRTTVAEDLRAESSDPQSR